MSDDQRSPILKPAVDASAVKPGLDQVERSVRGTSAVVAAEGRKGGEGLSGIGEGAKKGADKTERETGRMVAAIQRVQAATESGGSNTAAYFEALAKQRGVSVEALRPYLDGLKQAEQRQAATTASLNNMGLSAKQTAAALRQVPAQFTDIFTSLASGQQPLTVLLQQGGQLKDVFGGAGAAAQALGGYVASLITPTSVLAAGLVAVAAGYVLGSKEAQAYTAALVLSGNAAGTTAGQLGDMARQVAAASGATQGLAAQVLTQLASAGQVGAANLERFAQAAIELERAGGPAGEETAKAFAELAKSPLQASLRLTESTRYLSAATAEQIATLERQGRTVDAARLAQEAYASAIEQRTPDLVARLGTAERAWLAIKDAVKGVGDAFLEIGRADTLQQQVSSIDKQLANLRLTQGTAPNPAANRGIEQAMAVLSAQRELLLEQARLSGRAAEAQAARVKQEEAGVRWMRDGAQYLSDRVKLETEVLRIRNEGLAAGKSEEEIAQRLRDLVQQRYGSKASGAENAAERERLRALESQARLLAELSGLTTTYAQDLAALDAARRAGTISEERYAELVRALVAQQPIVRANTQALAKAADEEARAVARAQKVYDDYIGSLSRSVEARDKTLQQLRLEFIELTAGKTVRQELELLELERLATTYDQAAAIAALEGEEQSRYQRMAEQVREEIRLRRGILAGTAQGDARKANERAAEDAARDWERTADQISQSLADAIFDGGKGAGDLLKSYFRTLVLQPIIKAEGQALANTLGQVLGISGLGGSAGGPGAAAGTSALGQGIGSIANALGLGKVVGSIGAIGKAVAPVITAALIGRGIGQAISGGYSLNGGSGNSTVNAGLLLAGPLGAIAGGVVNRLFGRKLTDSGFEGSFSADGDFAGNSYQRLKGGLLRSSKTKRGALDAGLESVLDAGGQAAYSQAKAYADALGLPAEAMAGYTQSIKVSLKGLSEQEAQQAIADAVAKFQEGLLGRFSAQLEPLRRTGESLSDVAARVAQLQVFTEGLNQLGGIFGRVAGLSIDAREQLLQFAGGMEALQSQALSFVQQYYSREEIAGIKAREIQSVLQAAGITQDISTRDQFRGLVDSTDVSTEAGRQRLAQLLAIGGDFAQVADYLAQAGGTLASAASQAPAVGALAEIFAQPQQAQVDAINQVSSAVGQTNSLLERLIDAVQEARTVVLQPSWEVGGA